MQRRLAAILAADVVGYSRMMGADEAGTLAALKAIERDIVDPTVAQHGGRIVKRMGDGYLAEFPSVVGAVDCAIQWQMAAAGAIAFRIGINLGDVLVEADDLYGDGVNIAARLEALADPGGICLSEDAWKHARGKVAATGEALGAKTLKNIREPVQVYRLAGFGGGNGAVRAETGGPFAGDQTRYRVRRVLLSPFRHLGASEDAAMLASGLTETLAAALAHFEEFELIDPNAGLREIDRDGAREAGRRLEAHYILEGTVQVSGQRARIGVQLVDVEAGHRVWSETLNRGFEDMFALQDDVTAFVASTMGDAVGEEQARACAHKPLADLTLDEKMMRGVQLLHRGVPEENAAAREIFETICEVDSESMLPTLCLGWTYLVTARAGWPDPHPDPLNRAREITRGLMHKHPRSAHVHRLISQILFQAEEHDQGLAHARRAYDLNPWHADMMVTLGIALMYSGDAAAAIPLLERAFATDPYLAESFKRNLALALFLEDRPEEGLAILSGNEASAAGSRLYRVVNLVGQERLQEAAEESRLFGAENPSLTASTVPILRAFRREADRGKIIAALRRAGLPG